jgi:hypothetical protein
MTGNEKREEIIYEIRTLSAKRVALEVSTLSPGIKASLDRRYRVQIEKLVAVVMSPALVSICA